MAWEDQVVLVTGASRGIGKAIAMAFAKRGATVIGTATSQAGADKISAYLSEHGKGKGYVLNVCDGALVTALIKQITKDVGAPTVLINNAAITSDNLFAIMKEAQWDDVINTNLNGVYRVTKACTRAMMKARWGRVISISSVVATTGNPGQANYCAAKAGVIGMSKSLALELAGRGITFNVVAPGFIDTDMTQKLNEEQRNAIMHQIPMGHIGKTDDIVHAVLFLAAEEAAYITGQTIHVNGGMALY